MPHPDPFYFPRHSNSTDNIENLILVEGADDAHALCSLCDACKFPGKFRLEQGIGFNNIRNELDTWLDTSELKRLAMVIDADENVSGRWTSLRDRLHEHECRFSNLPTEPNPTGTIIVQPERPRLGIWLMPNNQSPGALEEFVRFLVPPDDRLWDYAASTVSGLPFRPNIGTETPTNWESKARIHSWLSWQAEPGKPIGQAITKRFLNHKASEASLFIEWLRNTFEC